jgi:hypothetical protein
VPRLCRAVSLTKRAEMLGWEAGTAFFDCSTSGSAGLQCSNLPCVLNARKGALSALFVFRRSLSPPLLSTLYTLEHTNESAGPVCKTLVHRKVARQHTSHQMWPMQQRLRFETRVVVACQMSIFDAVRSIQHK